MLLAFVISVESPTIAIVLALPRSSRITRVFWNLSRCSGVSRELRLISQEELAPNSITFSLSQPAWISPHILEFRVGFEEWGISGLNEPYPVVGCRTAFVR